jgi:predicted RNA-binding Zn-ribbon protein involved in translation (DUF1610 family)
MGGRRQLRYRMTEPGEIKPVRPGNEFHTCPACGYMLGFHVSFLAVHPLTGDTPIKTTREVHRLILICPECGARFDAGWKVQFNE